MAAALAPRTLQDSCGQRLYAETALLDGTSQSTSITNAVATDWADMRHLGTRSIQVVNGATNNFVSTVQGSNDGVTWVDLAFRADSSASYAKTGVTVAGSATAVWFLSPDDWTRFVRLNVSTANANGTTATIVGQS